MIVIIVIVSYFFKVCYANKEVMYKISIMIDFNNTKIAFAHNSTFQLRKAKIMFGLVARTWVVKISKWATKVALFLRIPMGPFVKPTIFSQFCGGETIDECDKTIETLGKYNVGSILDYSVEGAEDLKAHDITAKNILGTIDKADENPNIPYAVFKITGIARDTFLERINDRLDDLSPKDQEEYKEVYNRIDTICGYAYKKGIPIFIDAEDFCMQRAIDDFAWKMILKYNQEKAIVFNTIQAYRVDRFDFLQKEHRKAIKAGVHYGVKLVRGAYMEKERARALEYGYPSPIHKNKDATDKCFNKCMNYIVDNLEDFSLCLGTHNEESTIMLTQLMRERGIPINDNRIVFSQLLGMSDHITFNLSHNGYPVAKYVPFGPVRDVMPYLLRRAEENSSVSGQTGRELELIRYEIKRRKNKLESRKGKLEITKYNKPIKVSSTKVYSIDPDDRKAG